MNPKILLRIAAVLLTVHLLGHGVGHSTWDVPEDEKMTEVVTSMKTHEAEFMGATRSMADYYNGYSWMIFVVLGMSIWALLALSGIINEQRTFAVRLLYPIGFSYVAFAVIEYIFFFPFAAGISLVVGTMTLIAAFRK